MASVNAVSGGHALHVFWDVTTYVWVQGRKHTLLVATSVAYNEGQVYRWDGATHVLYEPPDSENEDQDGFFVGSLISSIDTKRATVKVTQLHWLADGSINKRRTHSISLKHAWR